MTERDDDPPDPPDGVHEWLHRAYDLGMRQFGPHLYTLDADWNPVPCEDVLAWGRWMETGPRQLARDRDESGSTTVYVSTIFLGLDHSFTGGPPVLWETMVFISEGANRTTLDDYTRRYHTRAEALAGHQEVCLEVRARTAPPAEKEQG